MYKFLDEVAVAYSQLKKQQEAYDSDQRKKTKYNKVLLKGDFLSSDDEVDDPIRYSSACGHSSTTNNYNATSIIVDFNHNRISNNKISMSK